MSGVAKAFVATFFGWMRSLLNGVWNFLDSSDSTSAFQFLHDNWKGLVVLLLCIGLVIDFFMYLLQRRNKP